MSDTLLNAGNAQPAIVDATPFREDRVVVRTLLGTTTKGVLRWRAPSEQYSPIPSLPDVLSVRDESTGEISAVPMANIKAVFFVRTHAGNTHYEEVKFFPKRVPVDLWVEVRLADGEALEGWTDNNVRLLSEPGFWLWSIDVAANNVLAYVPKTSVVEFHVRGFTSNRPTLKFDDPWDSKPPDRVPAVK
jgi:hypothetical protein